MSRHRAQIEFDVPSGQTLADTREWVEKWFSYYHPRMKAKVVLVKDAPSEQPTGFGGKLDEHAAQAKAADILPASAVTDDLL